MVRCGIMGLYSIREFLSFLDLEEFLSDMGVMAVNFSNYAQAYQFSEMLKQLVNSGRLTPVIQVSNELYTIEKYNKPFIDEAPDPTDPTPYETIQEYYTGWAVISEYCFRLLSEYYYYQKREVELCSWQPYGVSYPENWHFWAKTLQYISIYEIYFPKSQIIGIFGDSPFNELIAKLDNANQAIETLKQENGKLQAQIDQLQATAKPATNSNDKELPTRTANNAGKIISALAVELLELDITQPYGEANKNIRTAVELQGNTLSDDTVATWLKIAHETSK